jgi:hypothetical protein
MKSTKNLHIGGESITAIKYVLMITALLVMMLLTMSFINPCCQIPIGNCQHTTTTTTGLPNGS